jgi:pimeloyl-ACP methyl ester carboxylesterase
MLEGWWIENSHAANPAVVLYFGGNAEDVLHTAAMAAGLEASKTLLVNYRGYGGSSGNPGQQALYEDAFAIYDHAISRGVRPEQIVVMGRSLGSGVASMLAGSRPLRAAILITPFDSLSAVASRHYPFVPVRLLLRHPFPSIEWAGRTGAPALFIAAEHDSVIPAVHAQRLFEAWSGRKQIHVLPGTGHNDLEGHPDYHRLINEFLASEAGELEPARPSDP